MLAGCCLLGVTACGSPNPAVSSAPATSTEETQSELNSSKKATSSKPKKNKQCQKGQLKTKKNNL